MCACSILSIFVWVRHPALVGCGKDFVSMAVTTGCPSSEGLEKAMMGWKCKCPPELFFSHRWCQPRVSRGRLVWRAPMAKITGCPNSEGSEKALTGGKSTGPSELVFLHFWAHMCVCTILSILMWVLRPAPCGLWKRNCFHSSNHGMSQQ